MKMNICLIFCLFIKLIYGWIPSSKTDLGKTLFSSFLEKSGLEGKNTASSRNEVENVSSRSINYKLTIQVIKEADSARDKIVKLKTVANLGPDGFKLIKNKKVAKKIPFTE